MPSQNIHVVTEVGTLEDAYEALARLQKTIKYLINGNLDFENIRARSIKAENIEVGALTAEEIAANTITADKMSVEELSAIAADLGHITAGLIEAVNIFGSYIATANGTYPRCEMSSDGNLFGAYTAADNSVEIDPYFQNNRPAILFNNGLLDTTTLDNSNGFNIQSSKGITFQSGTDPITFIENSGQGVRYQSWGSLVNIATGNNLQTDLDGKATSGASTGSAGGATLNGGIPIGTSLATSGGGSVIWAGISVPSHSHSQN